MTCEVDHSTVGADPSAVILHPCCHTYMRGDTRLTSVSSVIRSVWPIRPSWDGVDEAVIENARDRGIVVDELFSRYIAGTLDKIPAGTRLDARDRFYALKNWWDHSAYVSASSQVLLADDTIAGTADLVIDGPLEIWDVKNTASIESSYSLQVAAYCDLYEAQTGVMPTRGGVIHVTQPKAKAATVRIVEYDLSVAVSEWRLLREFWAMTQRKAKHRAGKG
jgi:hypothetical protein